MDGSILDFSGVTSARLHSFVVRTVPPLNGNPASVRFPDGDVSNAYDWCQELSSQLVDKDGQIAGAITTYAFPIADDLLAVGHNLSPIIDPLMGFLTGRDYGDQMADLVRVKLPLTFDAIMAGSQVGLNGSGLMRVRTGGGTYWFFVGLLEPQHSGAMDFKSDHLEVVRESAVRLLGDAIDFPLNLSPEILQVLSGPDQISRVLAQVQSLTGNVTDLLGMFA